MKEEIKKCEESSKFNSPEQLFLSISSSAKKITSPWNNVRR